MTQTQKDDESDRDDRSTLEMLYLRYPWQRWFILGIGRFESNESLGLVLRSQVASAVGPRIVNSNRAQLVLGAGLAFNDERGVDVEPTQNVEALLMLGTSYYTYYCPRTNLDVNLQGLPEPEQQPAASGCSSTPAPSASSSRTCSCPVTLYNSYDSRPPNPAADTNDVGVVLSIGWTY